MEKIYADTYYITIYEDFKQKDGSSSLYSNLMFNPTKLEVMSGSRSTKKLELKEKVDKIIARITKIDEFTIKENEFGWIYERYVKWLGDYTGDKYEVGNKDEYDDHEMFTVEVSYYEDVWGIFDKLRD